MIYETTPYANSLPLLLPAPAHLPAPTPSLRDLYLHAINNSRSDIIFEHHPHYL
jgi:hypothetical protein